MKRKHSPSDPTIDAFSARTRNCLQQAGIFTISALRTKSQEQLLEIAGFGKKCLDEVNPFLTDQDLAPRSDTIADKPTWSAADQRFSELSARTGNCLWLAGVHTLADLQTKTQAELLEIPGFGEKCLTEVVKFLSKQYLLDSQNSSDSPGTWDSQRLLGLLASSVPVCDRLRTLSDAYLDATLDSLAQCQSKVEHQTTLGVLDDRALMDWYAIQTINRTLQPPARKLSDLLFRLQYLLDSRLILEMSDLSRALDVLTLDEEVTELLGQLDIREEETLRGRFTLGERRTLKDLGAQFGVSRERIRQIEEQAAKKLGAIYYHEHPLPRVRTAMLLTHSRDTVSSRSIYQLLHERGLAVSESAVSDFLMVWRAIDPSESAIADNLVLWRAINPNNYAFPEEVLSFAKTGLTTRQQALSKNVLSIAKRLVRQTGAVTPVQIIYEVGEDKVSPDDIITILEKGGLQELASGQWGRRTQEYSVPRTVTRKMLAICGPLNLRQLRRGLLRHQRRQGYPAPSVVVLRAVLEQYDEFVLSEDGIVRLQNANVPPKLGEWERVWLRLIESNGPVVHTDSVHRAFAENDLRPITAYVLMRNSSIVEPVGKQLFSLPGARITDVDVIDGKEQAIKIDADSVLTYDDTGAAIFETTVQQYLIRNGSLASGPSAVLDGSWKTVVNGVQIGEFTVGQPWIYGLDEARDALNIQTCDRIRIRFDTWTRRAHVSVVSRINGY